MSQQLNGHEVAKWFIFNNHQLANGYIDGNIKLNKLLYFANLMFYCVKKELLLKDEFVAFPKGPVVFSIYTDYRYNKLYEIPDNDIVNGMDNEQKQFLSIVNFIYGNKKPSELIEESHNHNIWFDVKNLIPQNPKIAFNEINNEFILYYQDLYNAYKNFNFNDIKMEVINSNIFYYDKTNMELTEDKIANLMAFEKLPEPQYIEEIDGELVFS